MSMYKDRQEAGKRLAKALQPYKDDNTVVLALPRGGIVLGDEVATYLGAPLDVVLVRKIGHPFSPEYAIGAVVLGEKPLVHEEETADEAWLQRTVEEEQQTNRRRKKIYYGNGHRKESLNDKTAIIVDDGIATGLTMQAAVQAAKAQHPKRVIVAVPVAPQDSVRDLKGVADQIVVLDDPKNFMGSVGAHYQKFDQVEDDQVTLLLRQHHQIKNTSGDKAA